MLFETFQSKHKMLTLSLQSKVYSALITHPHSKGRYKHYISTSTKAVPPVETTLHVQAFTALHLEETHPAQWDLCIGCRWTYLWMQFIQLKECLYTAPFKCNYCSALQHPSMHCSCPHQGWCCNTRVGAVVYCCSRGHNTAKPFPGELRGHESPTLFHSPRAVQMSALPPWVGSGK